MPYRVLARVESKGKPSCFIYQDKDLADSYAESVRRMGGKATVHKMSFEVVKIQLPSPWASFLANGVADSLEPGEKEEIAKTLEHLDLQESECVDVLDDAHFHKPFWHLNWLLAGDYSTFIFHKRYSNVHN